MSTSQNSSDLRGSNAISTQAVIGDCLVRQSSASTGCAVWWWHFGFELGLNVSIQDLFLVSLVGRETYTAS